MWNHDVVKADGLVAFDACEVNMSPMMEFMPAFFQFASAQAIFLFARAIINMVKDVVFYKKLSCSRCKGNIFWANSFCVGYPRTKSVGPIRNKNKSKKKCLQLKSC